MDGYATALFAQSNSHLRREPSVIDFVVLISLHLPKEDFDHARNAMRSSGHSCCVPGSHAKHARFNWDLLAWVASTVYLE
jgi:hypothetical protein